jgi:hypothetical protein
VENVALSRFTQDVQATGLLMACRSLQEYTGHADLYRNTQDVLFTTGSGTIGSPTAGYAERLQSGQLREMTKKNAGSMGEIVGSG